MMNWKQSLRAHPMVSCPKSKQQNERGTPHVEVWFQQSRSYASLLKLHFILGTLAPCRSAAYAPKHSWDETPPRVCFFSHHVVALFKIRAFKEVCILRYLLNNSTVRIPKFQNKAFMYYACSILLFCFFDWIFCSLSLCDCSTLFFIKEIFPKTQNFSKSMFFTEVIIDFLCF